MPVEELGRSRQVADVINAIGERMITKYRDAQHAFRDLDLDRDGKVSQLEVRIFARKMGLTTESADSFFAAMGNHADESGPSLTRVSSICSASCGEMLQKVLPPPSFPGSTHSLIGR